MKNTETHPLIEAVSQNSVVLIVWSLISATAFFYFYPTTFYIPVLLYALIVIFSLNKRFSALSWIILLVSMGLIGYLNYNQWGLTLIFYFNTGVVVLAFWMAKYLCSLSKKHRQAIAQKIEDDQQTMEDFIVYDPETHFLRWRFALNRLEQEIAKSQRLDLPFSLLMIDVPQKPSVGDHDIENLKNLVAELLFKNIHPMIDIPFIGEMFGVILPETAVKEAEMIAWQMVEDIANILDTNLTIGIAGFPGDADTQKSLIEKTTMALNFGLDTGMAVVSQHHYYQDSPEKAQQIEPEEMTLQMIYDHFDETVLLDYLDSPVLDAHEWIIWVGGVADISKIKWVKDTFRQCDEIQFLFLWQQHMVVKYHLGYEDGGDFSRAFSDYVIKEVDPVRHYALIHSVDPQPKAELM